MSRSADRHPICRSGCGIMKMRPSRRRFAPPQDERKNMMALRKELIVRSPQRGRLEGRTVPIQRRRASPGRYRLLALVVIEPAARLAAEPAGFDVFHQ